LRDRPHTPSVSPALRFGLPPPPRSAWGRMLLHPTPEKLFGGGFGGGTQAHTLSKATSFNEGKSLDAPGHRSAMPFELERAERNPRVAVQRNRCPPLGDQFGLVVRQPGSQPGSRPASRRPRPPLLPAPRRRVDSNLPRHFLHATSPTDRNLFSDR